MTEYRLAPAAERDLEAIWVYTFQEWGVGQANHYVDIITEAFAELEKKKKTAPACDHIRSGYRRRSIERHVIYFRATEYGIAVIRVLRDRMDVSRYI
ncbi:type II toxin-antitoxin system RelE/ParE family toxin [Pseudomonas viridiflava]|uniref:type II toxin-antitoxin system RelE/ParE family toxin n=1 Tax=Pseudomonas viridiflava TaxID=33069 RepID=UPI000F013769|nr:type II toxin-antitoxin system RelE/ParE family toxin [Pseudomonas viridiflava]